MSTKTVLSTHFVCNIAQLFYKSLFMKKYILILFLSSIYLSVFSQSETSSNRWRITSIGEITWQINENLPHFDNIEMSGLNISTILNYGVNADSSFFLNRKIVWPMLRTIPNDTRGSLIRSFNSDYIKLLNINGKSISIEKVKSIILNGLLTVKSTISKDIELTRRLSPSIKLPVYIEQYSIKNLGKKAINIEIPVCDISYKTDSTKGVEGVYSLEMKSTKNGSFSILKGDSIQFGLIIQAHKNNQSIPEIDIHQELKARKELVAQWQNNLVLETPNSTLNNAFAFAKIRASESIFDTKGGLMHSPGGEEYYAAIWANDQAEYIGPFFPFLGYKIGNEATLNAYLHFARYINKEYKPIPSSIVAEGLSFWNGVGDRGDQAMIAYGASRFALGNGDKENAEKLWNLIEWCLEYLKRNVNDKGVVKSDADELEHRFPAGDANLCTSSLYYDALLSASLLGKELNKPKQLIADYQNRAKIIRQAIEKHFGNKVEGFDTYRYYEGNDVLRAWICMPLTVGIYDRKQGTISALFSPKLWTKDGLATQAGKNTFWDRSTLYALKGVFAAGEKEKALQFLEYYSNRRLLGEHVPYPVEAYPEGNQRHLSAESGLYCRIFTEGLFGIRPTGFKTFELTPQLPNAWNSMSLKRIKAFGETFDILISRENEKINIKISTDNKIIFSKVSENGVKVGIVL